MKERENTTRQERCLPPFRPGSGFASQSTLSGIGIQERKRETRRRMRKQGLEGAGLLLEVITCCYGNGGPLCYVFATGLNIVIMM